MKKDLIKTIKIFGISKIIVLAFIFYYAYKYGSLEFLKFYDGANYLEIAQNGYSSNHLCAFFPLYPLLIYIFHFLFNSYLLPAILISNVCSFITAFIINKLSKNNLLLFCFSPILIFLSVVYTESLYLMLTILTFYYYKKQKYIQSSIFAGLSILSRNSGVLLLIAVLVDMIYKYIKEKNILKKDIIIYFLIASIIGCIYPIYLYINYNDFLYFVTVQNEFWGRENLFFINAIYNDIVQTIRNERIMDYYLIILNWGSYLVAFILALKIFKKEKVSSIYLLLALLAFGISFRDINYWNSIASISLFRYVLGLFPIYLYFKPNIYVMSIIATLSILNILLYFNNYFIA